MNMADVRVYRNSRQPAQLQALAFAQGNEIHLGPGQEQHLPHEAWHVVQQREGRVKPTLQLSGLGVNTDPSLEREAEVMGRRAALGGTSDPKQPSDRPISDSSPVIQPMLGFEIEMLALIDKDGRPLPEKTVVGTCGPHLSLDVDHGPSVAAPTPRPAADARYDVDQRTPGVAAGAEVEMRHTGAGAADPRPALQELDVANWQNATNPAANQEFTRPTSPIEPRLDNAALALLDASLQAYSFNYKNWEPVRAQAELTTIIAQSQTWLDANRTAPGGFRHPHRRGRWNRVQGAVLALQTRARAHSAFWTSPANAAPPANLQREFRPAVGPGAGAWHAYHPLGGMGTDEYASILEIVTRAYPPETVGGQANILAAMNAAVTLATDIENAAGANLTTRVQLNTIANVAGVGAGIHIGNPAQPAQTTHGSIQATGGVDLAQLPSYILSMTGTGGPGGSPETEVNTEFRLKHHSDTDDDEGRRVLNELPRAVSDATAIVNDIKAFGGGGPAPSLVNLRGLVTLVCQYLRMGRFFFTPGGRPLSKNIVPLLSRTDLSQIYDRLVPDAEKTWLGGGGRLNRLITRLSASGRNPTSPLFTNSAQTVVSNRTITCQQFVTNVFTAAADGVTGTFGGFRQMNPESVDPTGARDATDWRKPAAAHREGMVFELRNIVKRDWHTLGRFPKNRWVRLAEQQIAVIAALNARDEAAAAADQRVRWAGYGAAGGPHRLDVASEDDPNW